jgi:hypothetical protein
MAIHNSIPKPVNVSKAYKLVANYEMILRRHQNNPESTVDDISNDLRMSGIGDVHNCILCQGTIDEGIMFPYCILCIHGWACMYQAALHDEPIDEDVIADTRFYCGNDGLLDKLVNPRRIINPKGRKLILKHIQERIDLLNTTLDQYEKWLKYCEENP